MISIELAYRFDLGQTAQLGTPDGSAPNPPDVVVCPTAYPTEMKVNNVDRTLILKISNPSFPFSV